VLETDASDTAIGGRLYQQYGGEDHNIGFGSKIGKVYHPT
jgi:hypothetical protein